MHSNIKTVSMSVWLTAAFFSFQERCVFAIVKVQEDFTKLSMVIQGCGYVFQDASEFSLAKSENN
jgi:hypothetical protein